MRQTRINRSPRFAIPRSRYWPRVTTNLRPSTRLAPHQAGNSPLRIVGYSLDISDWLNYEADLYEWTGYFTESGKVWDAVWNSPDIIAFHYDHIAGNTWLWAHEGAHGEDSNDSEFYADTWADRCTGQAS
jgi:hypothetical protein